MIDTSEHSQRSAQHGRAPGSREVADGRDHTSQIERALRTLFEEGEHVAELRAIGAKPDWAERGRFVFSGYFNDFEALATEADKLDGLGAEGVYVTLNCVRSELLGRANNRIKRNPESTTSDDEVQHRQLLLIDFDPERPPGIPSTEKEMEAALSRAREVERFLEEERGFPEGVLAMSGNGAHLLFRIDLPAEDGGLVKRFLEAVAARFPAGETGGSVPVEVDTTVHSAGQLCKVYGTTARKGDETERRPYRRARLVDVPSELEAVPRASLRDLTQERQQTSGTPASGTPASGKQQGRKAPAESHSRKKGSTTESEIREALSHIPERPDYDLWIKIIAGVLEACNEDKKRAGRLLKEWSPEEQEGEYAEKLDNPLDDVGYGTVVHHAKRHGYEPAGARAKKRGLRREAEEKTGKEDRFDLEGFKNELENLPEAKFRRQAFDLIDRCKGFERREVAQARNYLKERGFSERDFQSWRAGVNAERKKAKKAREADRKKAQKKRQRREAEAEGLPCIELNDRPSRDVVSDILGALRIYNDPPSLYLRDGRPVRIGTDGSGKPRIEHLTGPALADHVARATNCIRTTSRGVRPTDPPRRLVQRLLTRNDLPFPPLEGVTEVPVLRPDGSVLDEEGYDEETQIIYRSAPDYDMPKVPSEPSAEDVGRALSVLREPLKDFPFAKAGSYPNMLALLITPMVRPLIGDGSVPLAGIDAPVRGTGKSLLADVLSLVATGRPAATIKAPMREEEWRKQITSLLRAGTKIITIDDVKGTLRSNALQQALTTSLWQDRILGKSKMETVPQRSIFLATGNNLRPAGDMIRRCYLIRLDAKQRQPWVGREFEHENLRSWVRENRGQLVWAILVLARAWDRAGRPDPEHVEPLGGFEAWTKTLGGILEHAGVNHFLSGIEKLWETSDPEETLWASLLEALHAYYAGESFTTKELSGLLKEEYGKEGPSQKERVQAIIDDLPEKVLDKLHHGKARGKISRTLGMYFSNRKKRRFGARQWHVEAVATTSRATNWRVRHESEKGEPGERGRESSESGVCSQGNARNSHAQESKACEKEKRSRKSMQTGFPDSSDRQHAGGEDSDELPF